MNISYNTISINGEAFNCLYSMSLKDLILYFDFDINNVIIEYNYRIIPHNCFEGTFLKNQDSVEIITIVGGG